MRQPTGVLCCMCHGKTDENGINPDRRAEGQLGGLNRVKDLLLEGHSEVSLGSQDGMKNFVEIINIYWDNNE